MRSKAEKTKLQWLLMNRHRASAWDVFFEFGASAQECAKLWPESYVPEGATILDGWANRK